MKKYEKPAIGVVEVFSTKDCMTLQLGDSGPGAGEYSVGTERGAKGKEDSDFEDDDW